MNFFTDNSKNLLLFRVLLVAALFSFVIRLLGKAPQPGISVADDDSKVLACWTFQPGSELRDSIGKSSLKLNGKAQVVSDPDFGGVLECFTQTPGEDKPHGAATEHDKGPTPSGAFTIEAWVKLKEQPDNPAWVTAYLVDKTYVPKTHANTSLNKDYFFLLRRGARGVQLQGGVGLGSEVINFNSEQLEFLPGVWRHLAFAYDGRGSGFLFADKKLLAQKNYPGKGAAAPGKRHLSLGERCGGIYSGLPGWLGELRILEGLPKYLSLLDIEIAHPCQRDSFIRMEQEQNLRITVKNLDYAPINDLEIEIQDGLTTRLVKLGALPARGSTESIQPLPTRGKAGAYEFKVMATAQGGAGQLQNESAFTYHICKRQPEFLPMIMWASASIEQMKEVGFTHSMVWMDQLNSEAWAKGEPLEFSSKMDKTRELLNEYLREGLWARGKISPGRYFRGQKTYEQARIPYLAQDRQGKQLKAVDFLLPRVQQFAFDTGRSLANNVGMFPAMDMVIVDSEFRDGNQISFRPETRKLFENFAGYEIPESISLKSGVNYTRIDGFPANRVIPDSDPVLTFYRWFWGGGDGCAGFLNRARDGLRDGFSKALVYWDPVVRCPSKWGSGGELDIIGHWTYVYPDPLVMGLATDEVFAMKKGGPAYQQVSKMTQIIWYRSQTTGPLPEDKSKWAEWERRQPEAKFITIPPDMLEIAFWQKMSRPVQSIQYHGGSSLWDLGDSGSSRLTNPETAPRLAGLARSVVRPLGPALMQVPDRPARVAMLESFTSQMYSGGTTYGTMRSVAGRMHGVLTRAHLQTEIIYDETILRDGLDQYQILVLPDCPVMTDKVLARIQDWQEKGGILVADETLAAALLPDILLPRLQSSKKADSIALARKLRQELGQFYLPYAEADSEEAIVRVRSFGSSDYLFAFNDHRTYGDYLGQHKKVMEKGLPLRARLALRRPEGTVYDLLASQQVSVHKQDGTLHFDADFGPGEGCVYLVTAEPIAGIQVSSDDKAVKNASLQVKIKITGESGNALDAVVPLRLDILDPGGEAAEHSGWYAARGGELTVTLDLAPNDRSGEWSIEAQELASGKKTRKNFRLR